MMTNGKSRDGLGGTTLSWAWAWRIGPGFLQLFLVCYVLGLTCLETYALGASAKCSLKKRGAQSTLGTSSGSGGSGSGSGGTGQCLTTASGKIATTWYAGWHGTVYPPSQISWSKYSQVIYAFATTTPDVNTVSLEASDEQLLPSFVASANQNGVKASLSIGGWSGSQYFSTAVADETNRTAFVQTVLGLVTKYDLDGIDFDWEYPNRQGIGCNAINSQDSSNFLAFLQALRAEPIGEHIVLSAAVGLQPFMGPDDTPLDDVSQFAKVLDFVTIMDYDVWGTWTPSGVGPNAPLNDTCAPSAQQEGSAVRAVAAWTGAGFPAAQLVLGVASYGHSFSVAASAALDASTGAQQPYPAFDAASQPHGDAWDGDAGVDQCGNPTPVGGIFDFWGLIDGGFLNSDGTPADGISYRYDNCSQTPYVYNPNTQVMVSFDDATSFAAKGKYIQDAGLGGFAMWQAGGDSNDILLDAVRGAIGNSSTGTSAGC